LHNPANVTGIKAFKKILPNAKAVAVFDTAFHQTMKPEAYLYATPYQWYTEHKVRKYGFHGTSHQYVSERVYQLLGDQNKKIIVAHLGNGASLCAIKNGLSIDTTMGFTPLAGIPMGTRSGDIDPAIISFIMNKEGWNAKRVIDELNSNSGFLALSGFSSDARDVLFKASQGNKRAILTLDIYARRIAGVIGEYHVLLGGLDAIAFTAGIGENAVEIREKIMNNLSALGVILDESANQVRGEERLISTDDSKVKVYLVPTNEEVVIARDTYTYCLN
jgi:acetate kinase